MNAIYARMSEGNELGIARQVKECKDVAPDAVVYSDDDISASKGKARPGYKALMAAVERGEIKRVVCWQSSRLWRNRRERVNGIETFARHNVSLHCVKGASMDFSTAQGRSLAVVIMEFDTLESAVKAERVQAWAAQRAESGLHHGGPTPYGYRLEPTGDTNKHGNPVHRLVVVPTEARKVKSWFARVLAKESLESVARSAGISVPALRARLRSPTYAGLRLREGVEYPGTWKAIVAPDVWRAAVALLDGRRALTRNPANLLTGVARCARCDRAVRSGGSTPDMGRTYRCDSCWRTWRGAWLDEFVDGLARARLAKGDLALVLARTGARDEDTDALLDEAAGIRARLSGLATDAVLKGVDVSAAVAAGKARLAQIDALTTGEVDPVLASVAKAKSPVKAYERLEPPGRQAVIRRLMDVVLTAPPRGRYPTEGVQAWYLRECVQIQGKG